MRENLNSNWIWYCALLQFPLPIKDKNGWDKMLSILQRLSTSSWIGCGILKNFFLAAQLNLPMPSWILCLNLPPPLIAAVWMRSALKCSSNDDGWKEVSCCLKSKHFKIFGTSTFNYPWGEKCCCPISHINTLFRALPMLWCIGLQKKLDLLIRIFEMQGLALMHLLCPASSEGSLQVKEEENKSPIIWRC